MTRRITDLEGRWAAANRRGNLRNTDPQRHYLNAGRRLWVTGGYTEAAARAYCIANRLTEAHTEWVLTGRKQAEKGAT